MTPQTYSNLWTAIRASADRLDELGRAYLDRLPFMSNPAVCRRLCRAARQQAKVLRKAKVPEDDWPWYLSQIVYDGHVPYAGRSRNGSLHFLLGFSAVSQDAHLRNLLEIAEGRESKELDFPVIEELDDIVARVVE